MRKAQTKRYYDAAVPGAFNSRGTWTADEDRAVLAQACPDPQLAATLGRTIRAIQHRRHLLRKNSIHEETMEEL